MFRLKLLVGVTTVVFYCIIVNRAVFKGVVNFSSAMHSQIDPKEKFDRLFYIQIPFIMIL